MSQLILRGHGANEFRLNVTQFRSPMTASINSVQTRTMLQHFPIRCGQPDIQFTCRFRSRADHHAFQGFVREHQTRAQDKENGEVDLWWPERNIEHWTGYIVEFKVAEKKSDFAPQVQFGVLLVNSLMSERTRLASVGAHWTSIWGPQIPAYRGPGPLLADSMLQPPTPPSSQTPQAPASVPGQGGS